MIQGRRPESHWRSPMWTNENRVRYDRGGLRYPSDLTDAEWAHVEPLIPPARRGGAKRTVNLREVVNGLMYVLSTGCQWRAIPKDLPPRSTVYDYFDLWGWDGTLDRIHEALYVKCRETAAREAGPTAAIIDSQVSRARKRGVCHRPFGLRRRQEDQGQEAPCPRRYAGPADARARARRRRSGPGRRGAGDGEPVRRLPVSHQALRRRRLPGDAVSGGSEEDPGQRQRRDRQAIRSGQGLPRPAQALDRRAHPGLARPLPQARQRLGVPQPQGARLPPPRLHPPHAQKTMQSQIMIPDRL